MAKDAYKDVLGSFSPALNETVGRAYFRARDGHLDDATGEFQKAVNGVWPIERLEYETECDPE